VKPLISYFYKTNNLDDFFKLLMELSQLGCPIEEDDLKFFSFIIFKEEKVMKAVELFEAFKENGYYSALIFLILINGSYNTEEIAKALVLFDEMKSVKCEPYVFTYNFTSLCHVDSGKLKDACYLFHQMKEKSWVPSVPMYTSLVNSLCKIV
jgi:pentatricopeptide repeat protein